MSTRYIVPAGTRGCRSETLHPTPDAGATFQWEQFVSTHEVVYTSFDKSVTYDERWMFFSLPASAKPWRWVAFQAKDIVATEVKEQPRLKIEDFSKMIDKLTEGIVP